MRVYARNGFMILLYWLVIKLCCWFWKRGELYDKTPDFAWKLLFFFSKPDCFFGLLFRKKNGHCVSWEKSVPPRVEAGKREKWGLFANRRTVGRRPASFATADCRTKEPDSRSAETKPRAPSPFDREGNTRNFSSLENQALFATQKKAANKLFSLTLPLLHTTTSVEK